MRIFADFLRQQSAFLVSHIARWRADQLGDSVFFLILTHVKAQEFDAQLVGKALCNLGLANACRTYKQQACKRLSLLKQPCP